MTVGALCDLGIKPSAFEWELSKLDIGDFHMHFERAKRQEVEGVKFGIHAGSTHTHDQDEEPEEHGQVHAHAHEHEHEHEHEHQHGHEHEHDHDACGHDHNASGHDHGHDTGDAHAHDHEHHAHDERDEHDEQREHEQGRSYAQIRALIESSDLSDFVKNHALGIFRRVAVAEAKIHGATVESIGFHEIGALDSIADIVLACVGIEELGVEKIFCGPLADGRGWIECAHGRFPIPAPATLEILNGIPVGQIDEPYEFITPTGAAIAAEFAAGFGPMPRMTVEKIGYGVGSRDIPSRPNVLRAVVGELAAD